MVDFIPYIKKGYVSKAGTTPVYVRYNYSRTKRTLITTGFSIEPKFWDEKKSRISKTCPQFLEIDSVLTKIRSKLGFILSEAKDNCIDPTVEYVLLKLEEDRNYQQRSAQVNIFNVLEDYIEERKNDVSTDQIKDYRSLRKHLTNFKEYSSQPVNFRNLNFKFYNEFMDYLFHKAVKPNGEIGLVTNSAGKIIRLLKGFVNYQTSKGTIPSIDMKCFKVVEEEVDTIYLNEDELKSIMNLDLSHDKELDEIRDVFIVGCYTGLRWSDLSRLKSEHIDWNEKMINIKQCKVHKAVTIPLYTPVINVLRKYNDCLPIITSYKFNEKVKELGKLANITKKHELVHKKANKRVVDVVEKWELISSHTCRRSFCTNMYNKNVPAEKIMKLSGHKSPAAFLKYIKVSNQRVADELRDVF